MLLCIGSSNVIPKKCTAGTNYFLQSILVLFFPMFQLTQTFPASYYF